MTYNNGADLVMDEMSIVDIFTKLIFDAQSPLSTSEQMVIAALSDLVPSLSNVSRRDLSEYLRAMGVDEMIQAVDQIKSSINCRQEIIATGQSRSRHYLPR